MKTEGAITQSENFFLKEYKLKNKHTKRQKLNIIAN